MSDSFPFKWINKKWKEGFYVTSMATSHTRWAVVMSRNAGFVDQCVELDFQYPSEGIHRRWDAGGMAPASAYTHTCILLYLVAGKIGDWLASKGGSFLYELVCLPAWLCRFPQVFILHAYWSDMWCCMCPLSFPQLGRV